MQLIIRPCHYTWLWQGRGQVVATWAEIRGSRGLDSSGSPPTSPRPGHDPATATDRQTTHNTIKEPRHRQVRRSAPETDRQTDRKAHWPER
eukprot:scaffold27489_cov53-Phaeocystis_antarctica.AAC.2